MLKFVGKILFHNASVGLGLLVRVKIDPNKKTIKMHLLLVAGIQS